MFVLTATAAPAGTTPTTPPDNKYVKVLISIAPDTLNAGGRGELLVLFSPVDGIHVTAEPPVEFRFDSTQVLTLTDEPDFDTDKENGYLASGSPVRQAFVLTKDAKPGTHVVKGALIYYYCSDDEGWCTRFTQPLELPLIIMP